MTLMELLVTLIILGVVAGAVFTSLLMSRRAYLSAEAYVHVQQEARQAFDAMARELRQARASTLVAAGSTCTFQIALGYNLAAPCPPNDVCWGARDAAGANQVGWKLRYQLTGTQLIRQILNAADQPQPGNRVLANDVSQLTFEGTNTITVQLQVQQASGQLPSGAMAVAPSPLVTRVRLRNS